MQIYPLTPVGTSACLDTGREKHMHVPLFLAVIGPCFLLFPVLLSRQLQNPKF
jgi:hypothetical protein